MKKVLISIMLFTCIIHFGLYCQKSKDDNLPPSFSYKNFEYPLTPVDYIDEIIMPLVNVDSMKLDDEKRVHDNKSIPFRYGYSFKCNFNMNNSGTWDKLNDGSKIWRLKIRCPGALSIDLTYDKFVLTPGSKFYLYNESKDYILGPYTYLNNKPSKKFVTGLTPSDITYLEYYEPQYSENKSSIQIRSIIYGYINIEHFNFMDIKAKGKKDKILTEYYSDFCSRDANCPEGNDLCKEKLSVSRFKFDEYFCSGCLLNNTLEDFTPYYLTADHCIRIALDEKNIDTNFWHFQFGYLYETCDDQIIQITPKHDYLGADILARYNADIGSDFALLRMRDSVRPKSGDDGYENSPDVYFNGWDRSGSTPFLGKSLHHPWGYPMKIAVSIDSGIYSSSGNKFWYVQWDTNAGFPDYDLKYGMQRSSSGSPLFDTNRRVIGQLWVGPGACGDDDKYGKFNFSWNGNGTYDSQLSHWLDPDSTGIFLLNGIHLTTHRYGIVYDGLNYGASPNYLNAFDSLKIGAGIHVEEILPFEVDSGVTLTLKAGREITIKPCTQILSGSEFKASIGELSCTNINEKVKYSDPESIYTDLCSGSVPIPIMQPKEETTTSIEDTQINNVKLIGSFPNPVFNEININYFVNVSCPFKIVLTNVFGNYLEVTDDLTNQTHGYHTVKIDVKGFHSGVYYYTLLTPFSVETKKFLIVK